KFEGDRQQSVSSQHGNPIPEHFVAGRPTTPEIVVVHTGKIIVHERVGVNAFERAGERERDIDVAATSFGRGETKNRSQSFSTRKKTVTHRLVERGRLRIRLRQVPVQCAIDQLLASGKIRFEIHVRKTDAGLFDSRYS